MLMKGQAIIIAAIVALVLGGAVVCSYSYSWSVPTLEEEAETSEEFFDRAILEHNMDAAVYKETPFDAIYGTAIELPSGEKTYIVWPEWCIRVEQTDYCVVLYKMRPPYFSGSRCKVCGELLPEEGSVVSTPRVWKEGEWREEE